MKPTAAFWIFSLTRSSLESILFGRRCSCLSCSYAGQKNKMCSGDSIGASHSGQFALSDSLKRYRYSLFIPCPVMYCDVLKFAIESRFRTLEKCFVQLLTRSGKNDFQESSSSLRIFFLGLLRARSHQTKNLKKAPNLFAQCD